jgi:hypothetical protein
MKIKYSLWQGSRLLSVNNVATDIKEIDKVVNTLNDSDLAKKVKFNANVMEIEVNN